MCKLSALFSFKKSLKCCEFCLAQLESKIYLRSVDTCLQRFFFSDPKIKLDYSKSVHYYGPQPTKRRENDTYFCNAIIIDVIVGSIYAVCQLPIGSIHSVSILFFSQY